MDNKTITKVAELFNTNRTYFNEAQRLKDEKPEPEEPDEFDPLQIF